MYGVIVRFFCNIGELFICLFRDCQLRRGTVRDLAASRIKRQYGIKDYGNIAAHGGVMDRFDSVIFTAPAVYLMVSNIPVFFNL